MNVDKGVAKAFPGQKAFASLPTNLPDMKKLFYTYVGTDGAGGFAFIYILGALIFIYSILRWG